MCKHYNDGTVLWFAFKLYLYRVLSHLALIRLKDLTCCDLLSNCIFIEFYHITNQESKEHKQVVICFQIVSLSSSITSLWFKIRIFILLWFAFKLYLYRVLSHRKVNNSPQIRSCDLLSNCIFIEFYHINWSFWKYLWWVVICFQIVSLSSSITSSKNNWPLRFTLWFAFKLYLYRVLSHLRFQLSRRPLRCYLL